MEYEKPPKGHWLVFIPSIVLLMCAIWDLFEFVPLFFEGESSLDFLLIVFAPIIVPTVAFLGGSVALELYTSITGISSAARREISKISPAICIATAVFAAIRLFLCWTSFSEWLLPEMLDVVLPVLIAIGVFRNKKAANK